MLSKKKYFEVSDSDFKILSKSKTQLDFWENAHKQQESFWTSGTSFEIITKKFKIMQKLRNKNVLVVGVGQGQELYGFHKRGAHVSGLDISKSSFDRFGRDFQMHNWENLVGKYDVVTMHLVAQHLSDTQLRKYLLILSLHLSPKGRIYIQFLNRIGGDEINLKSLETKTNLKSGGRSRNLKDILNLMAECDLNVLEFFVSDVFKENQLVHISIIASGTK